MNYTEELGKLADHQSRMLKNVSIDEMLAMSQAILDAKRIYVAGWGRAGNNIKMLSMDCSQIGLHTHIVGDNSTPSIHEGDILVIGSGSGKTASMQLFAKQAKSHGAKTIAITNAIGAPLASWADVTLLTGRDSHTIYGNAVFSRVADTALVDMLYMGVILSGYGRFSTALDESGRMIRDRVFEN